MFREFRLITEIDFIAVSHFLLGNSYWDDDLDDRLFWGLVHCLYL